MASVNDDPLHLRNIPPRHLLNSGDIPCEVHEGVALALVYIEVDLASLSDLLLDGAAECRLFGDPTYVPLQDILSGVERGRPEAHRLQHLKRGGGRALQQGGRRLFVLLSGPSRLPVRLLLLLLKRGM